MTVLTWYPITPSCRWSSTLRLMKRTGSGRTARATFAVVQAEDELAAIGMVVGAGWAGARAMTATSGPGISLMSEFVGLAYFAEIPVVIIDVQRMGPAPACRPGPARATSSPPPRPRRLPAHRPHPGLGRGVLHDSAVEAFDLAQQFQTPVFVATDLDLGMNLWLTDPFPYPEKPLDRGKVLSKEDLERLGGFERYRDVDGDGVCYRTIPGTEHPAGGLLHPRHRPQREVRATASAPRTGRRTSTAWHGSSRPAAPSSPAPVVDGKRRARSA